ncbi:MAG: hypothetical protein ACREDV_03610, partial [Methylocella sp.]
MRRGAPRKFAGASGLVIFVSIHALAPKALAGTRPRRHAPGLVPALWEAAVAWKSEAKMPLGQLYGKTQSGNVTSS